MKGKSLAIRFAVLAVVLLLAGLALWSKPIKKGMDLEGGHSMVFKVDTNGNSTILNNVIDTLKERVDPRGVKGLEWRPVGSDRIEVRMPVGSKEAQAAKRAYLASLKKLADRNVDPAYVRRVVSAAGAAREALIDSKLGIRTERGEVLAVAAALHDRMTEELGKIGQQLEGLRAEMTTLTQAQPPDHDKINALQERIDRLRAGYDVARGDYLKKLQLLRGMNVRTRELSGILKLYISPKTAKDLPAADVRERRQMLAERLEAFAGRYPDAKADIGDVVDTYTRWADVRGPLDDPEDLIRLIRRAGVLEFRIAPRVGEGAALPAAEAARYRKQLQDKGPQVGRDRKEPYQWFKIRDPKEKLRSLVTDTWGGDRYLLLSDEPGSRMIRPIGGDTWKLDHAGPTTDGAMNPAVSFDFDDAGSRIFATLTGQHVGDLMAILLDDEVYSAPVIRTQITGSGIIEGTFTQEEVSDLVRTLRAGSLRARVNPEPQNINSIGPTLGAANIARGQRAAYVGLLGVLAFMAVYYLLSGLIANFALALNIFLVLAAMAAFEVTFTLPGIAGLILTIGIAVDANVLIFERLREEQEKPQSIRMAIQNAYQRALSAIVDGNITTLLTCAILAWVGTQEVRGFAITLGIGIAFSLFTSLLVTRWIFRLLSEMNLLKNKVFMLRLMGIPKVNWIGKRRLFWGLSTLLLVVGVGSLIAQRNNILGIEFSKGTRAVIRFRDDALIGGRLLDDALVAEAIKAAGEGLKYEKVTGENVQVNELKTETHVQDFVETYDAKSSGGDADGAVSRAEWARQGRQKEVFALLDANGDGRLDKGELGDRLPEPRYQITTSEDRHKVVREAIDEAFKGLLDVQAKADYSLMVGMPIADLELTAGKTGYRRITQRDLAEPTIGGSYREELLDNVGGVLLAFTLKDVDQAMTPVQLRQRLLSTRLQAGREDVAVVHTTILPLKALPTDTQRFSSFGVIVRTDDIDDGPRADEAWENFATSELSLLQDALGTKQSLESLTNFDAAMTARTSGLAIVAIILSWGVIILYVWFRFGSAQWGLAAVICLVHDTLVVLGLVAVCGWLSGTALGDALLIGAFKIDLAMIAALLTVIGYSVNDTIVVFDRIRENRGKLQSVTPQIINRSINQTLSRTLLTSCTTLIVVVVMYIWGGDGIHGFSFALLVGVLFGTYSSIAIASPLLMGFKQALTAKITTADARAET